VPPFLRQLVTPTPPLSAAARHYVSTNLYASAIEEVEAGVPDSGGRNPLFGLTPLGWWHLARRRASRHGSISPWDY
jgi:hypothetical protein